MEEKATYDFGFHDSADEYWLYQGSPSFEQGWKLYISASILNFETIIKLVAPTLIGLQIPFKFVLSEKVLRKLNSGMFGYSQIGKSIVVYLCDHDLEVINLLKRTLEEFRGTCPNIPLAIPLMRGGPLYYRYGSYTGRSILVNGSTIEDDRSLPESAVPAGIDDKLVEFVEKHHSDAEINKFLRCYPTLSAISQSGKSGVFLSMSLNPDEPNPVVLKMGYKNGATQPDGRDGHWFVCNEHEFYREMRSVGCDFLAPQLLDSHIDENDVALVLERIPGPNLQWLKTGGALTEYYCRSAWEILLEFHDRQLILSDPKLANFVVDVDRGEVRAIDFESSFVIGRNTYSPIRTFFLSNTGVADDVKLLDRLHFLMSILFKKQALNTISDQVIEFESFLRNLSVSGEDEHWAKRRLFDELGI